MANDAFQKLKSTVNRGITTISVKTSSSLEKSKIKTHIESLGKEIESRLLNVGTSAYKLWEKDTKDYSSLNNQFVFIKQKYDEIEALKCELAAIDERDNQILGNNIDEIPTDGTQQIICTQCGTQYETAVKFCRKCGNKMTDN